jgi:hypothetical protein
MTNMNAMKFACPCGRQQQAVDNILLTDDFHIVFIWRCPCGVTRTVTNLIEKLFEKCPFNTDFTIEDLGFLKSNRITDS